MFTTISPAPVAPTINQPRTIKDQGPVFAVIDIDAPENFRPKNVDTVPSDGYNGVPHELSCRFAAMYNADWHSIKNNTWACVAIHGQTIFLRCIYPIDRPNLPDDFPPGTRTGLTYEEALELQASENLKRLKLARVPRNWTIALRPLVMPKGGAQ